jgi:hypothetical protein
MGKGDSVRNLRPQVSYGANEYLVLWDSLDKGAEIEEVIGRRVTGNGTVMTGDTILISTAVAENSLPDMNYSADTDRYIIVWQQEGDIYSQSVLPDGTLAGEATAVTNTPST